MATNYALRVNAPISGETGNVAVATAATTAGQIAFSGAVRVWIQSSSTCHISFGSITVAAPTTTGIRLMADQDYVFDLRPTVTNARVKLASGASAGTLRWARVA